MIFEAIKNFINFHKKNFERNKQYKLMNEYLNACAYGDLEKVKYCLTSPNLKKHAEIDWPAGQPLLLAIRNQSRDVIEYLLNSSDLKKHSDINKTFQLACSTNNLEVVKEIVSSYNSYKNFDINSNNGKGFELACSEKNWKIVEYLLKNTIFDKNLKFNQIHEEAFKYLCEENKLNLIRCFIFDLNIEKTKNISSYLKENENLEIEKMFDTRDLSQTLETELPHKPSTKAITKRLKV